MAKICPYFLSFLLLLLDLDLSFFLSLSLLISLSLSFSALFLLYSLALLLLLLLSLSHRSVFFNFPLKLLLLHFASGKKPFTQRLKCVIWRHSLIRELSLYVNCKQYVRRYWWLFRFNELCAIARISTAVCMAFWECQLTSITSALSLTKQRQFANSSAPPLLHRQLISQIMNIPLILERQSSRSVLRNEN